MGRVAIEAGLVLHDDGVFELGVGDGLFDFVVLVAGDAELAGVGFDLHAEVGGVGVVADGAVGGHDGLVGDLGEFELIVHFLVAGEAEFAAGGDEELGVVGGVGVCGRLRRRRRRPGRGCGIWWRCCPCGI